MSDVLPLYYFLTVHDIQSFLYLTVICWAALQIIDNAWRLGIADCSYTKLLGCRCRYLNLEWYQVDITIIP